MNMNWLLFMMSFIIFVEPMNSLLSFQVLGLSLQWPPSWCRANNLDCHQRPIPEKFLIHGVWPMNQTNNGNVILRQCSKGQGSSFHPFSNVPYINALDSKWMNLDRSTTPPLPNIKPQEFWK
ncbi:hypothetical protein M9H77_05146 [Catharanthus roseus]|uniref:Uncharacterized protein n=1 Tax=Catharanthus roseus TaxID=4058 RepID=A0ACC0CG44_CATRO|nr:hypothetical protein M9H77_05146 [Catharanthus roseus]